MKSLIQQLRIALGEVAERGEVFAILRNMEKKAQGDLEVVLEKAKHIRKLRMCLEAAEADREILVAALKLEQSIHERK